MDLSNNKLTGGLPRSFEDLTSLQQLNLSYNQLEGLVPDTFPYNNSYITFLQGNPRLCGSTANQSSACATATGKTARHHASRLLIWILPTVIVASAILVVTIVVIYLKHLRKTTLSSMPDFASEVPRRFKLLKLTAADLWDATEGFNADHLLGRGSSGNVYKAVLRDGIRAVAVKVLSGSATVVEEVRFMREMHTLAQVRHRNIVRVLGCCFNLDIKAIILELIKGGSLDACLHNKHTAATNCTRPQQLDMHGRLCIINDVAQALVYLHFECPEGVIVHCDLKPSNILLDEEQRAHICDFGICRILKSPTTNVDHGAQASASMSGMLRGSVGYIPPEYAYRAEVSPAGDVYSFGIVVLEVLTGRRPTDMELKEEEEGWTLVGWVQRAMDKGRLVQEVLMAPRQQSNLLADEIMESVIKVALSCAQEAEARRPSIMHTVCTTLLKLTEAYKKMSSGMKCDSGTGL